MMNGAALELLQTLAPKAYDLIMKSKSRKTDEQLLVVMGFVAQTNSEIKDELHNMNTRLEEVNRINTAKLDVLVARG